MTASSFYSEFEEAEVFRFIHFALGSLPADKPTFRQLFTTESADLDILIRAHGGDPKVKMYRVDFDREYPDPSNQELQVAVMAEGSGGGM